MFFRGHTLVWLKSGPRTNTKAKQKLHESQWLALCSSLFAPEVCYPDSVHMAKLFSIAILQRLLGGLLLTALSVSANASSAARFNSEWFEDGTRQCSPAPASIRSAESFLRQRALTNPRAPKAAASFTRHNFLKLSLVHPQLPARFAGAPKVLSQRRAVVSQTILYRSSSLPCQGGRAPPASAESQT